MADQDSKTRGRPANQPPEDPDVFSVNLRAPDRASLAKVVRELGLDIDHQHPAPERDAEAVAITAFLTQAQIDELRRRGWDVRVDQNLSDIGRERQKEVSREDRFKDGAVPPTGLGRKVRETK